MSNINSTDNHKDLLPNGTEKEPLTKQNNYLTRKPKVVPKYSVHRNVLTHEVLIQNTGYEAKDKSILFGLKQYFAHLRFWSIFSGIIPIVQWLPKYSFKNYLVGDIIAGVTVAVMHIPQGMAYGILAGVTAGVGLYMAFFPVLVYVVLGTSRHISMGTFSVISMMTLKVVQSYANAEDGSEIYTPLQVVCATAVMVGIIHLIMAFLRLGALANLLSEPLVNGFTTAAAIHVIVSQLKDLIGVPLPRHKGAFKLIYTVYYFFEAMPVANVAVVIFSICVIVFMCICNELLKPWFSKKCRFPIPAELLAVVTGTLLNRYLHLEEKYEVTSVGHIPLGLPPPEFPPLGLFPLVFVDSIAIAVVSYSIVVSMGLIFAKKHSYEIFPNQELFAMGISNVVGGCFQCIPIACSLSRSLMQDQTGGVTQIASLISAGLIMSILLWCSPFFETLPKCVLAGVIVVALKGMLMQAKSLKKFSQQGKLELLTWIITFFGTVFFDIIYGLLAGVVVSILSVYIKGLKPSSCMMGVISTGDAIYVNLQHHKSAKEVPNTKIFHYNGSLNFATKNSFKKTLFESIEVNTEKLRRASFVAVSDVSRPLTDTTFRSLILDFSALGHLDVAGCGVLNDVRNDMKLLDVRVFIACPCDKVYNSLIHFVALGDEPFEIFPTLHDAVLYSNTCLVA
ncbi:SLC26A2 family protein [Megaselia abdita]